MPTIWKRALIFLPWYLLSLIVALLDLLYVGYLFAGIIRLTAKNKRKLTEEELLCFKHSDADLDFLKEIDVIECSRLARVGKWIVKRKQLGLGIATTIHFSREIDTTKKKDLAWLVHEVAHTIQFKYRGLIYIPEALIAQQFSGYAFGGKETLEHASTLKNFNPEQQAEIFTALTLTEFKCALIQEIKYGLW